MRVSGKSRSNSVAGAVAGILRSGDAVELETIGQPAVYNAVKAILIASRFVEADGLRVATVITSELREIQGSETTVILFKIGAQKE